MSTKTSINFCSETLTKLIRKRGLTQSEVATMVGKLTGRGVSPQAVQQWCAGTTEPRSRNVLALSQIFRVPESVLRYGTLDEPVTPGYLDYEYGNRTIPVRDDGNRTAQAVRTPNIQPLENVKPKKLYSVVFCGGSMSPTIEDGDICCIDGNYIEASENGIYAFRRGNFIIIRRVLVDPVTKKLDIVADNESYPYGTVKPEDFHIAGRCVFITRQLAA